MENNEKAIEVECCGCQEIYNYDANNDEHNFVENSHGITDFCSWSCRDESFL